MTDEALNTEIKRWTAKRRGVLVLSILKGETTPRDASRKHGLKVTEIQDWKARFLAGAENNLRTNPRSQEQQLQKENQKLKQKVGELVMDMEILKKAIKPYAPFN